ncbi:MAG: TRAP transporter substrate-binding protein DctP [Anaerolineae bacterium]|nr:TRAP transporter substrate-binding protein DctP [Anaerolineae bacterium]
MRRREFLKTAAKGAVFGGAAAIGAACTTQNTPAPSATAAKPEDKPAVTQAPAVVGPAQTFEWNMATSWPISLDTIYGGAQVFAERMLKLTGGKFKITPRPAGDPQGSPGTAVLDAVSQGAVQAGHTAAYYYIGKSWVCAFATAVPFGLTLQEQNAWLFEAGGLKLINEVYAKKFNIVAFPAGNTGCQWGGWWRKEINTPADLKGLKMRIPGIGGQVMAKLGVNVITLAGGEIFQAMQTGTVDAAEWVGPYDDEKLGFNKVAKIAYYPGWWEPAPTLEVQVNLSEFNKLPAEYKEMIQSAAHEANTIMPARYDTKAPDALDRLVKDGVQFKAFSNEIMEAARKATFELLDEQAAKDPDVKKIHESWNAYRLSGYKYHKLAENTFANFVFGTVK